MLIENMNFGVTPEVKKKLFEAWAPNIKAVKKLNPEVSESELVNLAVVLENTQREADKTVQKLKRAGILEATQVSDIGGFKRYAFEIITGVFPNLVANEIVSIQALKQKVGQIFYLTYTYGSTKGNIAKGDVMFDPFTTVNDYTHYTSEEIPQETVANAGTTTAATACGYLAWRPVRPGTVKLTDGTSSWKDNGNGGLVTDPAGVAAGTIDYTTGAVVFTAATTFADDLVATYEYNLEYAPAEAPEIDMKIGEWLVTARTRKLRARYAFDAAYDIEMQHGIDIEQELADAAVAEIRHEIDLEIINDLYTGAGLTSTWNKAKAVGVSQEEQCKSFVNAIISASNDVFKATKRATANFVIVGKDGADAIEALPDTYYKPIDVADAVGPHVAGELKGRWKVIKNPHFADDAYLVGYKGKSLVDAGYVYAPYLPVFATKMIMLDDFLGRQGFASSYAKKMINNKYYVKGTITNVPETINVDTGN